MRNGYIRWAMALLPYATQSKEYQALRYYGTKQVSHIVSLAIHQLNCPEALTFLQNLSVCYNAYLFRIPHHFGCCSVSSDTQSQHVH